MSVKPPALIDDWMDVSYDGIEVSLAVVEPTEQEEKAGSHEIGDLSSLEDEIAARKGVTVELERAATSSPEDSRNQKSEELKIDLPVDTYTPQLEKKGDNCCSTCWSFFKSIFKKKQT